MAEKRTDKPTRSPSGEEEEEVSSQEVSESESEPVTKKPSAASKLIKPTTSVVPPASSSSSGEDESGSDSESDIPPPTAKFDPTTIKPISSKPMENPPTKPRSKPTPGTKSGSRAKRPALETDPVTDSKRSKKKPENRPDPKKVNESSDDPKKQLFQRLWSEEDEVVILKGMSDYTVKKKSDPVSDMNAFHEFIKKSLHVDVSKTQLSDKVRRLKKKYVNNSRKGKSGIERIFSKPHEQMCYDLSKKIWGGNKKDEGTSGINKDEFFSGGVNGSVKKNSSRKSSKVMVPNEVNVQEREVKEGDTNVELSEPVFEIGGVNVQDLPDEIVKDGWKLVTGDKKIEWEKKFKKVIIEEVEVYLKRQELMHEQVQLVLEAMKSSQK